MHWSRIVVAGSAVVLMAHTAGAAEIRVLSGGAIEPGLKAAVAAFERETGHTVKVTFNTAPQIRERIAGGDRPDVVIAPPAAIEEFAKAGKVAPERVNVGRVGLGVAVRPGAPAPDISSVDTLKQAVLQSESLVFNQASTGIYFESWLKKMGLYDQVTSRITRYPDGASVMEHLLAKGTGREFGVGAMTEILLYKEKGLRLVGPLPAEAQNYTAYLAVPMTGASAAEIAETLVRYLGSPGAKALFQAAGIE